MNETVLNLFDKARENKFYVFILFGRNFVKLKVVFLGIFLSLLKGDLPVFQVITLVSNKNHIKVALTMFFDRLKPVINIVKGVLVSD